MSTARTTRRAGLAATLLCLAALAPASRAAAEEGKPAAPAGIFAEYLTDRDYPEDAIKRQEQGTAAFRAAIGIDGEVTGCTIIASSGSASLDATTCRIVIERVRFTPAADSAGKPVPGSYEGRIRWVLPDDSDPINLQVPESVQMAMGLWVACAGGEAAKLALSDLAAAEVAERAFAACSPLEARVAAEIAAAQVPDLEPSNAISSMKQDMLAKLPQLLSRARALLKRDVPK